MTRHPTHLRPSPLAPRGFTFIEVLFAIIILGIGSIMIAGMLPVAIKQTSDTRNAITGKAACEAGYAYLQALAAANQYTLVNSAAINLSGINDVGPVVSNTGSAGWMVPLTNGVINDAGNLGIAALPGPTYSLQSLTGSRLVSTDPKSQWIAFYGRTPGSVSAKVVLLSLHLQNVDVVPAYVTTSPPATTAVNTMANGFNEPRLLTAVLVDGGVLGPDTLYFPTSNSAQNLSAPDTGAFVIVADSPAPTSGTLDPDRPARNNGRVFRLGKRRVDLDSTNGGQTYELQPDFDLPPRSSGPDALPNTADDVGDTSMDSTTNTKVWVVGKGLQNPSLVYNASSNPYVGLVQDVGVLTTQLQLSN